MTLQINSINAAFLSLQTDDLGVLRHISDHFSFYVPTAKYHPAFKSGKWDGKIRLLQKGKFIYSGLKSKLIDFLTTNQYSYQDNTHKNILISKQLTHELLTKITLPFPIRDYQQRSVTTLLEQGSGLLISPTSSGKSLILFLILVILLKLVKPKKIIIGVPTISLVQQLASDFISYCTTEKMLSFFNNNVHLLYGGQEKDYSKRIMIGTFASLSNLSEDFFHDADVVIGDECHLLSKTHGKHIFENSTNAIFRMGCTGTLQESILDKLVLEGLFGKPIQYIKTVELIENKQATPLKINPIVFNYSTDICKQIIKMDYPSEYDFLMTFPERLKIIANFISSLSNNTLVLFTKIEKHGDLLYKALTHSLKEKELIYITGKTDIDIREESRKKAEDQNNLVLLCSYGVFSQGVNIKNLHNIVFASPYKAKIKILQSIGRGLRLHDSKSICQVFDFVDDCRVKGKSANFLFDHFMKRYELYIQEGFDVDITHYPTVLSF